jgi:drug/metabolite transporter (DMT)-like permease
VTGIVLALAASLSWGIADFVGPVKARVLGTLRVLIYAQVAGLIGVALLVAARREPLPSAAVLLAIPASISGTLGLYAYYRGVIAGAVSIVAPVAGASAVIPVILGIATGDRPGPLPLVGIACALLGVALASREPGENDRRLAAGVGLAILAAIGFGFYFPFMHVAGDENPWWASLIFRTVSTMVILTAVFARRPPLRVGRVDLAIVVLVGLGDMMGNLLFAASSGHGLVSVTSVLASLYPIVTIALARIVLQEHVAGSQRVGIGLTLTGVALIAAG